MFVVVGVERSLRLASELGDTAKKETRYYCPECFEKLWH